MTLRPAGRRSVLAAWSNLARGTGSGLSGLAIFLSRRRCPIYKAAPNALD